MDLSSKHFDTIRTARKTNARRAPTQETKRGCDWPDCTAAGTHPAPAGPRQKGRRYFCLEHVSAYNKNYDFFEGMAEADIEAYRRAATTGHRPTWRMGNARFKSDSQFQDPLELVSHQRAEKASPAPRAPRISSGQARALNMLGLEEDVKPSAVKQRYKDLLKRYHPDTNGGDRQFEQRLQRVIQAYEYLKASGFC